MKSEILQNPFSSMENKIACCWAIAAVQLLDSLVKYWRIEVNFKTHVNNSLDDFKHRLLLVSICRVQIIICDKQKTHDKNIPIFQ